MYVPAAFAQPRLALMHELMHAYPFATLVAQTEAGLLANHQPLLLGEADGQFGVLRGHLARANPMGAQVADGARVLVIFQGPDAYVSPSWYPSKAEHGKVVPTWNFAAVHCQAVLRLRREPEWLREHLGALTDTFEQGRAEPWSVHDAPDGFIDALANGVTGMELTIESIEGKWKLSQNRGDADREGVIEGLAASGDPGAMAVAHMMRAS